MSHDWLILVCLILLLIITECKCGLNRGPSEDRGVKGPRKTMESRDPVVSGRAPPPLSTCSQGTHDPALTEASRMFLLLSITLILDGPGLCLHPSPILNPHLLLHFWLRL